EDDLPTREEYLLTLTPREIEYVKRLEKVTNDLTATRVRSEGLEDSLGKVIADNERLEREKKARETWEKERRERETSAMVPPPPQQPGGGTRARETFPNAPSFNNSQPMEGSTILVNLPTMEEIRRGNQAQEQRHETQTQSHNPETYTDPLSAVARQGSVGARAPSPQDSWSDLNMIKFKTSDVPMLGDEDVVGIDGRANVALFCATIEDVTTNSNDRLKIARVRLGGNIKKMVGTRMFTGNMKTYSQLKKLLFEELCDEGTADQEWSVVMNMEFDQGVMDARPFVNAVLMQHDMLVNRFPNHIFPRVDNVIKRKLLAQASPTVITNMKPWLEERIPVFRFLDIFRQSKTTSEGGRAYQTVNYTPLQPTQPPPILQQTSQRVNLIPPPSNGDSNQAVQSQIEGIKKLLEEMNKNRVDHNQEYCVFCRVIGHLLRDCPQAPPRGVCWACFAPDHRRGDPVCPKYVPRARHVTHPSPPSA
ncbi:MAG: hypothetical protein AAGJ80_00740, partial [Cyanobacteria bacterium J06553_1]